MHLTITLPLFQIINPNAVELELRDSTRPVRVKTSSTQDLVLYGQSCLALQHWSRLSHLTFRYAWHEHIHITAQGTSSLPPRFFFDSLPILPSRNIKLDILILPSSIWESPNPKIAFFHSPTFLSFTNRRDVETVVWTASEADRALLVKKWMMSDAGRSLRDEALRVGTGTPLEL